MQRVPESPNAPHAAADVRERSSVVPDSARPVEHDDFLFHLYRGSELLEENRVLEAKEELEFALTLAPLDFEGQNLLGAVYFRLGLYPRAIQIYEGLEVQFPRDVSIKISLALCYLKTGQPEPGRRVLVEAVQINPEHKHAWGYLGLALQKLGDLGQAQVAFERGGHLSMARRIMEDRRQSLGAGSPANPDLDGEMRSVAETAFSELDAGELHFALAQPEPSGPDTHWHTVEIPHLAETMSPHGAMLAPSSVRLGPYVTLEPPPAPSPKTKEGADVLALDQGETIGLHPSGPLLVRTTRDRAFVGRLEALRVVAGAASTRVMHRRSREAETSEILGGIGAPLAQILGAAELVLGARAGHALALVPLQDELAFVREDFLLGFESTLSYESGRFALDATGDGAPIVQLRGSGAFVVELASRLGRVPCAAGSSLLVRREWVVGWTGRLLPRALPPGESLSGQRGLMGFSGEGSVLLVCAG